MERASKSGDYDRYNKLNSDLTQKESEISDYTASLASQASQFEEQRSIVEQEAGSSKDRNGIAGVFYNRLKDNWSLGSDVTTYYAIKVDMGERDLY
ncbi:MAG: endolytic transglycosylase MltG, partial [Bacteroidales bacterium]|nr:endolytic transglycosylase MltG [Bacteroidales bacterium]